MADRQYISQVVQIGAEATQGVAVEATKRLRSLGISLSPAIEVDQFRPMGQLYRALTALGKDSSAGSISGRATYDEIVYLLCSLVKNVSPTTPGTNSKLWTFSPNSRGGDTFKTFTIQQGDVHRAVQASGCVVVGTTIQINRDTVEVSGDLIGKKLLDDRRLSTNAKYRLTAAGSPPTAGDYTLTYSAQTTAAIAYDATPAEVQAALIALNNIGANDIVVRGITTEGDGTLATAGNVYEIEFCGDLAQAARTLTGTFTGLTPSASIAIAAVSNTPGAPTEVALKPILPRHFAVYGDAAHGDLGTTRLTRVLQMSFSLTGRFTPVWTINDDEESWAVVVEAEPTLEMRLTAMADGSGMDFLTAMRDGSSRFLRVEATGDLIETGYRNKFTLDFCGQVVAMSDFNDTQGALANEYTLVGVHDANWGKAFNIAVQNSLAAL